MSNAIHTWVDAYVATVHHLEASRGNVELEGASGVRRWPRTTGHDVIIVAALLDKQLRYAPYTFGVESLHRRWRACLDDLERYAWPEPRNAYPENRAFWSTAIAVCVHLDAATVPPPEAAFWEALRLQFDQPADGHRNANDATAEETLIAQRKDYLGKRGIDERYPKRPFPMPAVPRSTNTDAMVLATYWTNRLALANVSHPGKLDGVAKDWNDCITKIAAASKGARPDAVYAANDQLWSCINSVALSIDPVIAAAAAASLIGRASDAITNVFDDLPGALKHGAEAAAHGTGVLLGDLASGIGDVAGKAAKGFLGEFTTPLLVVGGGIAAVYLLSRSGDHHEEA